MSGRSTEVYDRRLTIYKATQTFLNAVVKNASPTVDELFTFAQSTDLALFLFDNKLVAYLSELYQKGVRLHFLHGETDPARNTPAEQRKAYIEEEHDLLIWFSEQLSVSRELFRPYLRLSNS